MINPKSPWYLFKPHNIQEIEYYNTWMRVTDIFPVNSSGIKTHRDDFAIAFSSEEILSRLRILKDKRQPDEIIKQTFDLIDNRDWKLTEARKKIFSENNVAELINSVSYRPFDSRFISYAEYLIDWPRKEVMQHLQKDNIALNIVRQSRASENGFIP